MPTAQMRFRIGPDGLRAGGGDKFGKRSYTGIGAGIAVGFASDKCVGRVAEQGCVGIVDAGVFLSGHRMAP